MFVYYYFPLQKKDIFSTQKKHLFLSNPTLTFVRYVIANIGPLPEWSATMVATGTLRTPVISQNVKAKY